MNRLFKTIVGTGLLAGTLDIIAAFIIQFIRTGDISENLLKYIAGGVLGVDKAMQGGFGTAFFGLLCHYFIAMTFTVLFFVAYPRIKLLRMNRFAVALLYGIFADTVMKQIVLPLSALNVKPKFDLGQAAINGLILAIAIGIPVAFSAHRYYAKNKSDFNASLMK
jgi:hypothetical protein